VVARLIYSVIMSLDGYVADADGGFDWAAPDEQLHAFVNELERPIGTYLYGRRMYEVMRYWATAETVGQSPVFVDYTGIWRAADKVVYSHTLDSAPTARTRIEREFDVSAVARLKEAATRDLSIGGPELAGQALAAGLVDECQLMIVPVVVGGGTPALPSNVKLDLELLAERRFDSGAVYLRYRVGLAQRHEGR
jgi:dihydrofolate reductase